MEVLTKPSKVVATASEIMNHSCWSEQLDRRRKVKGHGNRVFRQFSLHCGGNCEVVCYLSDIQDGLDRGGRLHVARRKTGVN